MVIKFGELKENVTFVVDDQQTSKVGPSNTNIYTPRPAPPRSTASSVLAYILRSYCRFTLYVLPPHHHNLSSFFRYLLTLPSTLPANAGFPSPASAWLCLCGLTYGCSSCCVGRYT